MEIYTTNVKWLTEETAFRHLSKAVPAERRSRLARCRSAADRARGLGAGLLLEYGLRRRGLTLLGDIPGCRSLTLAQGPYGKPYLAGETDVFFNLSHAGDYAAAVFAGSGNGIDIEQLRKARRGLAERFFTEAEAAYLGGISDERAWETAFIRIWTRKESYVKAAGEGLHLPLADFSVLEDRVSRRNPAAGADVPSGYALRTWEPSDGYLLSVCVQAPAAEELLRAEPEPVDADALLKLAGREPDE